MQADNVRNLMSEELETVVYWFLHRMDMDTRKRLMAELPQHYAVMFPTASPEVIAETVQDQIERSRR